MLNWTVPENEGLSITFFRVQYKKVGPNKGSWKTEDVEIESHRRKYEVNGLLPRKYLICLLKSVNFGTNNYVILFFSYLFQICFCFF